MHFLRLQSLWNMECGRFEYLYPHRLHQNAWLCGQPGSVQLQLLLHGTGVVRRRKAARLQSHGLCQ
jgi:hypothetical protein